MSEPYDFSIEFGSVKEFEKVKADIVKFKECRKRIRQNKLLNNSSNQPQFVSIEKSCTDNNFNIWNNCFRFDR